MHEQPPEKCGGACGASLPFAQTCSCASLSCRAGLAWAEREAPSAPVGVSADAALQLQLALAVEGSRIHFERSDGRATRNPQLRLPSGTSDHQSIQRLQAEDALERASERANERAQVCHRFVCFFPGASSSSLKRAERNSPRRNNRPKCMQDVTNMTARQLPWALASGILNERVTAPLLTS